MSDVLENQGLKFHHLKIPIRVSPRENCTVEITVRTATVRLRQCQQACTNIEAASM